jgi:hypothetical protein
VESREDRAPMVARSYILEKIEKILASPDLPISLDSNNKEIADELESEYRRGPAGRPVDYR